MEEKSYKTFVFIVDQDIFHTFRIEDTEYSAGLIAGMQSNPIVVDVTGHEHISTQIGWKYIDGKFHQTNAATMPTDIEDDYEVE